MKALKVHGSSMWPFLKSGDMVLIERCHQPKPGDLIVHESFGVATVHRYLADGLVKGDRLSRHDFISKSEFYLDWVVVEIVLRAFSEHRGRMRSASLNSAGLTQVITRWQTSLALLQLQTTHRWARSLCSAVLILNGFALRQLCYFRSLGRSNGWPRKRR